MRSTARSRTRVELATSQGWSGQVNAACRDLAELIAYAEQALPPDDPLTLHVRYSHAVWTGEPASTATRPATDRGARQTAADSGRRHISTLKTRLELAVWTGQSGQDRDALYQLLDQRDDWIRVCGPDHPRRSTCSTSWRGPAAASAT